MCRYTWSIFVPIARGSRDLSQLPKLGRCKYMLSIYEYFDEVYINLSLP